MIWYYLDKRKYLIWIVLLILHKFILFVIITKAQLFNNTLIRKNCIQILFQHTVTLIYTTKKLVSFTMSSFGFHNRFKSRVTSCNHAWNINLDTTCLTYNFHFIELLIYLFTFLFLCYCYYCFYWLFYCNLLLFHIKFYFSCQVTWSHPKIQIFSGDQLKRWQTKQVLKSHILCNYVSKENLNEAFPNQDAVQ